MHSLIVGLGNPGREHMLNRHNIGFLAIDSLAQKFAPNAVWQNKMGSETISAQLPNGNKITLVKPQSYMNLSGKVVQAFMVFYKLPLDAIWVLHDDIELEFLRLKVKNGGGHAGHNGLRSIDAYIGRNYNRLRLGVGRPQFGEISSFVLGNFTNAEILQVESLIERITDNFLLLLDGKKDVFLNSI
jgi:PTH1 family peptidyl-tRNA hydrolase